jgi:hypothetical protein
MLSSRRREVGLAVIARERSDDAIQTKLSKAFVWIASLPLATTSSGARAIAAHSPSEPPTGGLTRLSLDGFVAALPRHDGGAAATGSDTLLVFPARRE